MNPRTRFGIAFLIATMSLLLVAAPTSADTTDLEDALDISPNLIDELKAAGSTDTVEAIVMMDDRVREEDIQAALDHGLEFAPPLDALPAFMVRGNPATIEAYLLAEDIAAAEWNQPLDLLLDTESLSTRAQSVTGHQPSVGGPLTLQDDTVDGDGVGVAIVDSGIDATHPDLPLEDKVVKNLKFICSSPALLDTRNERCFANTAAGPSVPPDGTGINEGCEAGESRSDPQYAELWIESDNTDTSSGHGTHVAGIAAGTGAASDGTYQGVAPGASLYGLGIGEGISVFATLEAFDWVYCNHDDVTPNIKIINNSWGIQGCNVAPAGPIMTDMLQALTDQDITIIFAAGNDGGNGDQNCTSTFAQTGVPGVISVANYDDLNAGLFESILNPGSSRGLDGDPATYPDIAAPGTMTTAPLATTSTATATGIESEDPLNYTRVSGTSMAAPHAAGVAALMLQANDELTPSEVESILNGTAEKVQPVDEDGTPIGAEYDQDGTSFDKGNGLVNARAAVQEAATLAGESLGDTPPSPAEDVSSTSLYLTTEPTGLQNVDEDDDPWKATAPTETVPGAWTDHVLLTNDDRFWWTASYHDPGIEIPDDDPQDVTFRFWADAALTDGGFGDFYQVTLIAGGLVHDAQAQPVNNEAPRLYEVTLEDVSGIDNGIGIRIDCAFADTCQGNTLLYDSITFPSSLSIGDDPVEPQDSSVSPDTVCITSRAPPDCFGTIQDAVDDANEGETITVGTGTYEEAVTLDKALTLETAAGQTQTTLQAPPGGIPLTATAAAAVTGFTFEHANPLDAQPLVDAAGPVSLENNDLTTPNGVALLLNHEGATASGNIIQGTTSVETAQPATLEDNVIGGAQGTGLLVTTSSQAPLVEGNEFTGNAIHVLDDGGELDLRSTLATNAFDQATVVADGDQIVAGIFSDLQPAIDEASQGQHVLVAPGTYEESLTIGTADLTVCHANHDYTDCRLPQDTGLDTPTIRAPFGGTVGISIQANDVTVAGLTVDVPTQAGTGIDANGADRVTLTNNDINVGIPDGEFGLQAAMNPQQADYWLNPFVEEVLTGDTLATITGQRADDDGFLGAQPAHEPDEHIALLYRSQAPAEAHQMAEASEDPVLRIYEGIEPTPLMEDLGEDGFYTVSQDHELEGPLAPSPVEGIGPGTSLSITRPDGTFGCTANFVFQDDAGQVYLGTAGHCVLPEGIGSFEDPDWRQEDISVSYCEQPFFTTVARVCWATGELGDVAFAMQNDEAGTQFGFDFALIEIPDHYLEETPDYCDELLHEHCGEVRPWMPVWGGPTGETIPALGDAAVHYGHGVGVGATFPTEARAAVPIFQDGISFDALGWVTGGDSGSGISTAADRTDQMLVGDEAFGDITHSIVGIGAPLMTGTTIDQGMNLAKEVAGVDVDLVLENDELQASGIDAPTELIGINLEGASDALIQGNVLHASGEAGGIGIHATTTSVPNALIDQNTIEAANVTIVLNDAPRATVSNNDVTKLSEGPGYGIDIAGDDVSIVDNVLTSTFDNTEHVTDHADGFETVDQFALRISGNSDAPTVVGNTIQNWANMGLILTGSAGDGGLIEANTFDEIRWHPISLEGPREGAIDVQENTFQDSYRAISLSGVDTDGLELRSNTFDATLVETLRITDLYEDDVIDARLNDWSTYHPDLMGARVNDEGQGNMILQTPFLLADGTPEPGLPTASDATHSSDETACKANTDTWWTGSSCIFLTVQAAIDFSHEDGTVTVPMSQDAAEPTPYFESVTINENNLGEDLDGVTLCASVVAMECASTDEPARWGVFSDAEWGTPPVPHQGKALRMQADTGDSTSLFTRDAITQEGAPQVADLHGLGVDILLESGDCTGHDPRLTLRVDTNADGDADEDYQVYAPSSFDCPQGQWVHIDYLESDNWGTTVGETGPSDAHEELGPDHRILSMNLIWDGGSSSDVAWFDNQRYQDSFLREASDVCEGEDASDCEGDLPAEARERTILDAEGQDATIRVEAPGVTLQGITVQNTDEEGELTGVEIRADDVTLTGSAIQGNFDASEHLGDGQGGFATINQIGIRIQAGDNVQIQGNTVEAWKNIGIYAARGIGEGGAILDNTIQENRWHGILAEGPDDDKTQNALAIEENTVKANGHSALRVGTPDPSVLLIRENTFAATNLNGLTVQERIQDVTIDARLNAWDLVGDEAIQDARVDDESGTNDVLVKPYLDAAGNAHPPLPEVRCDKGAGLEPVTAALGLQDAIDLELPAACIEDHRQILLGASHEGYDPATVDTPVTITENPETLGVDQRATPTPAASIHATDLPALTFENGSEGSLVLHLTLASTADAPGIHATADDVSIEQSTFLGEGPGLMAQDASALTVEESTFLLSGGQQAAVDLTNVNEATIHDNLVNADQLPGTIGIQLTESEDPTILDNVVIDARIAYRLADTTGATLDDNIAYLSPGIPGFGGTATGFMLFGGADHTIERSLIAGADEGIVVHGASDIDINQTRIAGADTGIRLDAQSLDRDQPTGFSANNTNLALTGTALQLTDDTNLLDVDVTCVNWGVYHGTLIEQRISDDGTGNDVEYQPWTSANQNDPAAACLTPPEASFDTTVDFHQASEDDEETYTRLDAFSFEDGSDAGTREIVQWRWDLGDGTQENRTVLQDPDVEHSYDALGTFPVVLTVEDADGMIDRFIEDVTIENLEPALEPLSNEEIHHTEAISVPVTATDPESDGITLSADGPAGVTIDDNGDGTGTLTWDPTPDQSGEFAIEVTATDDQGDTDTETFLVTVENLEPTLDAPEQVPGALERTITFDVHAESPDEDPITSLTADLDTLPDGHDATFETKETDQEHTAQATFTWTPTSQDAIGQHDLVVSVESPGHLITETVLLDIRDEVPPPDLTLNAPGETPEGSALEITASAVVDQDAENDIVTWEATAEALTAGEEAPVDGTLATAGNDASWEGTVPLGAESVTVTFTADDGLGETSASITTLVQLHPEVAPLSPIEEAIDFPTNRPLHEVSPLTLRADASDDDGSITSVAATIAPSDGSTTGTTVTLDQTEATLWTTTLTPGETAYDAAFPTPGDYDITIEATDDDGLETTAEQTITLETHQPPSVGMISTERFRQAEGSAGSTLEIQATPQQPDNRPLEPIEWYRTSGHGLAPGEEEHVGQGSQTQATAPVGINTYEARLTDAYGAQGTNTMTVYVWGFITPTTTLQGAQQTDADTFRYDANTTLEDIQGTITLTNDANKPAQNAEVHVDATYHGLETDDEHVPIVNMDNTDATLEQGFTYHNATLTTDANGEATFTIDDVLKTMPGHHTITLDAIWTDTREHAPTGNEHAFIPTFLTASRTLDVWVGPSGVETLSTNTLDGLP